MLSLKAFSLKYVAWSTQYSSRLETHISMVDTVTSWLFQMQMEMAVIVSTRT